MLRQMKPFSFSQALDLFDLGETFGDMDSALRRVRCPVMVMGVQSDILFPIAQQREMATSLKKAGKTFRLFFIKRQNIDMILPCPCRWYDCVLRRVTWYSCFNDQQERHCTEMACRLNCVDSNPKAVPVLKQNPDHPSGINNVYGPRCANLIWFIQIYFHRITHQCYNLSKVHS